MRLNARRGSEQYQVTNSRITCSYVRWPLAEVASRMGELEDAKTILGLLLYLRRAKVSPL